MMTDRPIFALRLQALKGVDPVRSLRIALKGLLRRCGLKVLSIEQTEPTTDNQKSTQLTGRRRHVPQ
jgi:hypothetical protein